jgi:hypothetical protein
MVILINVLTLHVEISSLPHSPDGLPHGVAGGINFEEVEPDDYQSL